MALCNCHCFVFSFVVSYKLEKSVFFFSFRKGQKVDSKQNFTNIGTVNELMKHNAVTELIW